MEKVTLLNLLRLKIKIALPILGFIAVINGLWSGSLLMLVSHKIAGTPLPFFDDYDWLVYLFFVVGSFILTYYFNGYMIKATLNFGKEMTLQIINKLRLSNYESYLDMGEARVRTALEDVRTLESLPGNFTVFFNSIIMILAGIGYMFWLYPKGAIMMTFLIVILVFIYIYRNEIIEKDMDAKRDLDDVFMRNYNDFLHGFNKVKMSTKRSNSIFLDHITKNRDEAIKLSVKSGLSAFGNELLGDYFFYFLIGIVLFILPTFFNIDATVISGFMITLLFLMGPIAILINLMESIISYKVAFRRINEFNDTLTDNLNGSDGLPLSTLKELPVFETLYINDMSYQYVDKKGNFTFELKPINLKINKGEVIFISGSNGSGKSTFINLLSGLYIPKSGEIVVDDLIVTDNNRSQYRDMISCIFSDNYLFTENYDNFNLLPSNKHLAELLKKMKLNEVIRQDVVDNKIFQNLSSGQQKRLALIYSLLEDKEIFIFDEWAAEQDPEFRKYFYKSIIPDLKSKGKTIIAITHDDAYYKYCDRLIKFNYGIMLEEDIVVLSSDN